MNKTSFTVAIIFILILGLIVGYQNNKIKELENQDKIEVFVGGDIQKGKIIDSLQNRCDSLEAELWPAEVELTRYQMAYEIFLERNPKAAKQYGDIISNETE
jgi:hypothetical protein